MTSTEHLTELGYIDPLEVAEQRAAREQQHAAALAQADAHLAAGRISDALELLAKLVREAPEWTAPRRLIAHAEYLAGRPVAALAHLNWLEAHGVEHAELALLRAAIELQRRQFDEALACARYAQALQQPLAAADVLIGRIMLRRGVIDDAEGSFARALESQPQRADALAGMAAVALRRGDWETAVDWSLQALEQDMSVAAVHFRLGMALVGMERWTEATAALTAAAKLNPHIVGPLRWLAYIAARQGSPQEAEAFRRQGRDVVKNRRHA
ncbi:MAG: tetratricopeptide repeat protein [Planctomycetales bacterium]|nr:tetratricopeptide repeat protein [Planctomycetales bacterium]